MHCVMGARSRERGEKMVFGLGCANVVPVAVIVMDRGWCCGGAGVGVERVEMVVGEVGN